MSIGTSWDGSGGSTACTSGAASDDGAKQPLTSALPDSTGDRLSGAPAIAADGCLRSSDEGGTSWTIASTSGGAMVASTAASPSVAHVASASRAAHDASTSNISSSAARRGAAVASTAGACASSSCAPANVVADGTDGASASVEMGSEALAAVPAGLACLPMAAARGFAAARCSRRSAAFAAMASASAILCAGSWLKSVVAFARSVDGAFGAGGSVPSAIFVARRHDSAVDAAALAADDSNGGGGLGGGRTTGDDLLYRVGMGNGEFLAFWFSVSADTTRGNTVRLCACHFIVQQRRSRFFDTLVFGTHAYASAYRRSAASTA